MPNGLLIFFAYIVLEIYVLVQAAAWLGGWNVMLLLGLGFLLGALILQHNRTRILSGQLPKVVSIIFSSIAGVLFIIPGFVSDLLAVLLLLPPLQAYMGRASDKFFMRQGFNRLFRFGYFGNMNFPGQGQGGPGEPGEPEFREEIKVTVIDPDGGRSTEHMSRRKKIDGSNIIDVEIDDGK